jgi:hypothetical protein
LKILAIDPGPDLSAWCVLVDGRPFESGKESNYLVLEKLRCWRREGWLLAVEMVASYGMPVGREVFETCVWIGRFVECWRAEHTFVYRKDVKMTLCGNMRARDANIRAALLDKYGPGRGKAIGTKAAPGPLYGFAGDQWSALAVGLTALDARRREELAEPPGVPEKRKRISEAEVPF